MPCLEVYLHDLLPKVAFQPSKSWNCGQSCGLSWLWQYLVFLYELLLLKSCEIMSFQLSLSNKKRSFSPFMVWREQLGSVTLTTEKSESRSISHIDFSPSLLVLWRGVWVLSSAEADNSVNVLWSLTVYFIVKIRVSNFIQK